MISCLETQAYLPITFMSSLSDSLLVLSFPRLRKLREKECNITKPRVPDQTDIQLQQMSITGACQGICSLFQILAGSTLVTDCNSCRGCHYERLEWWLCQAPYSEQGLSGTVLCEAGPKLTFFLPLSSGILKLPCFLTPHCHLPKLHRIPISSSSWNQGGDIRKILIFKSKIIHSISS